MLVFLKLGGSLITDKATPMTARPEVITRLSLDIAQTLTRHDGLQLVVGHGSGSFGHSVAHSHGTAQGAQSVEDWHGFADVAYAASELHRLMLDALRATRLPVMSFKPSSSAICEGGRLKALATDTIQYALNGGLVPLVHGDVAFDTEQGTAIVSTEDVFFYLAEVLKPNVILLAGDYDGVMDTHGNLISKITPQTVNHYADALGDAEETDVTGGMGSKVRRMLDLVQRHRDIRIHIFSGAIEGTIPQILTEPHIAIGTTIQA